MTEANEPLIVDVDLKESDLQRANFWFGLHSWSNRLMVVVLPIVGLLLLWKADLSTIFRQPLPATGILVFLGLPPFYLATIWYRTKRGFANLKPYQTHVRYTFSRTGYTVSDGKSSGNVAWDAVLRVAESKHSFHIFLNKSIFNTVPKRCFKQPDDIVWLRDLLKRSLGAKATVS